MGRLVPLAHLTLVVAWSLVLAVADLPGSAPRSATEGFDAPKIQSPSAKAALAKAQASPPAPDPELAALRARVAGLEAELADAKRRLDLACRPRTRVVWVTSHHAYAVGTCRDDGGFDVTLGGRTITVYPTTLGPLPSLTQASPLPGRP